MSRIVDVDVEKPIKTRSSKEYRQNWEATFGEPEEKPEAPTDSDGIECKIRFPTWFCKVCDTHVTDPENHQYHAFIKLDE